jgi:hypothetical protein
MDWILKGCDLNKDVEVDDTCQLTLPDIQLKYADRVFRLYIKSLQDKAIYRTEESLTLNQVLPEALDHITYPQKSVEGKVVYPIENATERIENKIAELGRKVDRISSLVKASNNTNDQDLLASSSRSDDITSDRRSEV